MDGEKTPSEVQFETMQQELFDAIKKINKEDSAKKMLNFKQMFTANPKQNLLPAQRPQS